jgi:hypothetical protein
LILIYCNSKVKINKRYERTAAYALDRKVSRQEFLALGGLLVGTVLGFDSVIRLPTGYDLHTTSKQPQHASGYAASAYGR